MFLEMKSWSGQLKARLAVCVSGAQSVSPSCVVLAPNDWVVALDHSSRDRQRLQIQQPLGISVQDEFTVGRRAIQLLNEFRGHVVAAKGMVGTIEHLPGSHDLVTTLQRCDVIADGVDVEALDVMIDWMC